MMAMLTHIETVGQEKIAVQIQCELPTTSATTNPNLGFLMFCP